MGLGDNSKVKVGFLVTLLFCWSALAVDIQIGESYRVTSTLETTNGGSISPGTYIKVVGTHRGWAYTVQRLGTDLVADGVNLHVSQNWASRSVTSLTLDEVVRIVAAAPSTVERTMDAPCECNREIENAVALALQESSPTIRPVARPENLSGPETPTIRPQIRPANVRSNTFDSFIFKDSDEADQYFACYQKDADLRLDYEGTYRNSIRQMSQVYGRQTEGAVAQADMDTLMSCLIFRESAHWRGGSSSSNAKGLGQFTSDGRAEVREILEYRPETIRDHDDRIRERRGEREAGRISARQLEIDIQRIEAERVRHNRMTALKRMWEAMPMGSRPSASQITPDYTENNNNHEAIMAMSALLVRNCQLRLQDDGIQMDARTSLLACAGAYNMGVGGFKNNAIVRNGPQTLEGWLSNLRASSDGQSNETYNHLVSIHRCISDGENFPPCGTGADYCSALPMTDPCGLNADPTCLGECR